MADLSAEALELMRRLSQLDRSGEGILDFLGEICKLCADISGANDAAVLLLDQDHSTLVVSACHGIDPDALRRVTFQPGEGIAGRVLETGETERHVDVMNDPQFVELPWQEGRIRSLMAVPIRNSNSVVGVVSLHATETGVFGESEQTWIELVARQLASDIENAWLEQTSCYDPLTSVLNRNYFLQRLDKECHRARRHASPLTLLAIDIDRFSAVNELHGRFVGDMVLREFARRLGEEVRSEDLLSRYGGELFLLLLPHTDRDAAERISERIRTGVMSRAFRSRRGAIPCTVSIGVAALEPASLPPEEFIERSLEGLRKAKRRGRNAVIVVDD